MSKSFWIRGLIVGIALLGMEPAQAQGRGDADQSKVYIGGAIGISGYNTTFGRTNQVITSTGATTFSSTANSSDTMWTGYIGYRVSQYFSVEGGYWKFGALNLSTSISAPVTASLKREYNSDGFGGAAVLWVPVATDWAGLLKAGVLRTEAKASAADPGAGLTALPAESVYTTNVLWGAGVEYRLAPAVAARLSYEFVRKVGEEAKFGTSDIHVWSIGANYRF